MVNPTMRCPDATGAKSVRFDLLTYALHQIYRRSSTAASLTPRKYSKSPSSSNVSPPAMPPILRSNDLLGQLAALTADLLHMVHVRHCMCIVTDDLHLQLFGAQQFAAMSRSTTYLVVRIADDEDTLQPGAETCSALAAAKQAGCDVYVVYLANGIQVKLICARAQEKI